MIVVRDKFVFAERNINIPGGTSIKKNDVGIIESKSERSAVIFFVRIWRRTKLNDSDFKIFDVKKTGDGFPKKICNVCHQLLNTSKYAKNQNAKNNRSVRRPSCGECRKKLEGVSLSASNRREWLKKKPQNEPFECPVCRKKTIAGITSKVVLDHDHLNGKVRGWICDSCNTGIGRFKDDVKLMRRAIRFLR